MTEHLAPALDGFAAAAVPNEIAPAPAPQRLPVRFTGKGGEYFRIWIANLLLTILTLGIWSAWAKVRKTRYFYGNTQVGGAAFQYHGNPAAILRGRLLAGAFFLVYAIAGRVSIRAGMAAGAVLMLLGPWLFYQSMRFKLANTSWRGLRFGFHSTVGEAYRVLAPGVAVGLLLFGAVAAMKPPAPGEAPSLLPFALVELLALGLTPWLHARVKRYQHGRTRYGDLAFELEPSVDAFYGVYLKTFALALPFFVLLVLTVVGVFAAARPATQDPSAATRAFVPFLIAIYAWLLVAYGVAGAYFSARLQRLVWTRTHAGPVRFSTTIRARGQMRVWIVNGVLTLVTVGLYWPWAAVALARYRLESMTVEAGAPLEAVSAGGLSPARSATGEGAMDLFGWDIGL